MAIGERVLVVDDELLTLDALRDMLSAEGYEAVGASSAQAALELAKEEHFDVLLADLRMPGKDGLELVREFRVHSPDTAAIIITGYGSVDSAQKAIQEGVCDFIGKPIGRADLSSHVAHVLKRRAEEKERSLTSALASIFDTGGEQSSSRPWKVLLFDESGRSTEITARQSNKQTTLEPAEAPPTAFPWPGRAQAEPVAEEQGELARQTLSPRELHILRCIGRGDSNKQIASNLKISDQTVKNHISSILYKLNASNRAHAVVIALHAKWLKLSELIQSTAENSLFERRPPI